MNQPRHVRSALANVLMKMAEKAPENRERIMEMLSKLGNELRTNAEAQHSSPTKDSGTTFEA